MVFLIQTVLEEAEQFKSLILTHSSLQISRPPFLYKMRLSINADVIKNITRAGWDNTVWTFKHFTACKKVIRNILPKAGISFLKKCRWICFFFLFKILLILNFIRTCLIKLLCMYRYIDMPTCVLACRVLGVFLDSFPFYLLMQGLWINLSTHWYAPSRYPDFISSFGSVEW